MILGILCSGALGLNILKKLNQEYIINFVFTDKNSVEIIKHCSENFIDCFIGNPRHGRTKDFISNKNIDVLISINYLFLVEDDLIKLPKKIAFNIHGSLLPKYRGRAPHVWAIINNETKTGVTAHLIDKGCDTGDIIEQVDVFITKEDTGATILEKYNIEYYPIIKRTLNKIKNNDVVLKKQDENEATYFPKRTPEDGLINWNKNKLEIYNWIRAQAYPYPGAFTFINGNKIIIDKVEIKEGSVLGSNGQIIEIDPDIIVKVSDGLIKIVIIRENQIKLKQNAIFSNN